MTGTTSVQNHLSGDTLLSWLFWRSCFTHAPGSGYTIHYSLSSNFLLSFNSLRVVSDLASRRRLPYSPAFLVTSRMNVKKHGYGFTGCSVVVVCCIYNLHFSFINSYSLLIASTSLFSLLGRLSPIVYSRSAPFPFLVRQFAFIS